MTRPAANLVLDAGLEAANRALDADPAADLAPPRPPPGKPGSATARSRRR